MTDTDPQRQLAAALGRVASGLFILTARHGEAETGLLCSFVQQCSFQPPRISIAIKPDREVASWLTEGAGFILNILDDNQTDMVAHFGRGFRAGEPAFTDLDLKRSADNSPILSESLGYLDCRVVSRHGAGDHDLFIAQVVGGAMLNEGQPMVHVRKSGLHY
ncbi:MAG: flavin reductase family protein [Gemmataceae bacterium]|nr:flavin reductase family protein [Gemmataceae bacterium]